MLNLAQREDQKAVLWMDWIVPIGSFHVKFSQKCTSAEGHDPTVSVIYLHVLYRKRFFYDAIVDAMAQWTR